MISESTDSNQMCIHSCDHIYAHCMGYETWDSSREAGSTILFPSLNQWKMPIVCQMFTSHYAQVKKPYLKVKKGNMSTLTGGKSTTDRTWSSEPQSMCMTVSRCSLWICKHIPRALNEYRVARKHVRNYRRKTDLAQIYRVSAPQSSSRQLEQGCRMRMCIFRSELRSDRRTI